MLEIKTFGDFDIRLDNKSILKTGKRATKALDLLKYFIANKDRRLSPEVIIEIQWGDSNSEDPKNVLRTQIFRLRKYLQEMGLINRSDKEDYFNLAFENGYYIFRMSAECEIDALVFEDCIKTADNLKNEDPDAAIEKYLEAIELYKGEYLADSQYNNEWMYIARNRYHRLFVDALLKLFDILSSKGCYSKIIEIFEQAMVYEPYDESLHICFLETLLALNQVKNAASHYNYITGKMYREMSLKPSPAMKQVYQKIINSDKGDKVDLYSLRNNLTEDQIDGAFYCDADYFMTIYNLERRRALRMDNKVFLGLITILTINNKKQRDQAFSINVLKNILKNSLRKGDVFSQWNDCQIIFLLIDAKEENLDLITERIRQKFVEEIDDKNLQLKFSIRPISSPELFIG